jgi:GntR family transcriptional regulator, phosphonate transport system regulatory protein
MTGERRLAAACRQRRTSPRRKSVRIRSLPPSADEARHLQIAPTDQVLETDVVLVDSSETPLSYAHTCDPSSRVEFALDL